MPCWRRRVAVQTTIKRWDKENMKCPYNDSGNDDNRKKIDAYLARLLEQNVALDGVMAQDEKQVR